MSDPEENKSPDVSRDEVEGNIRTRGKTKLTGFPRDLTLSVLLYFWTFTSTATKEKPERTKTVDSVLKTAQI